MDFILTCVYFGMLALLLQAVVLRVCAGQVAMQRRRTFFRLAALLWCAMAVAKKQYIDAIIPPADALEHEAVAREVAELLTAGRYGEASSYSTIGHGVYQCFVGLFYYLTGAEEVVVYAVNGALGFIGLLFLLDILCRHSNCQRLPASVVVVTALLPSGLLWTTSNLKEGVVLWGICAMLYLTAPASELAKRRSRLVPIAGLLAAAAVRPHIAAAWLAAIAAGAALDARRIGLFVATAGGAVVSVALVNYLAPDLFALAMGEGVSATLSDRYSSLSTNEGLNGIALAGKNPVPVLSGLTLILFRPWPFEVRDLNSLWVGMEVWTLALLGFLSWRGTKSRLLLQPALMTHLFALAALAFYFSYMYNMGLVVRQRLMCFPAVLFLYFYPAVARQAARTAVPLRGGSRAVGTCRRFMRSRERTGLTQSR